VASYRFAAASLLALAGVIAAGCRSLPGLPVAASPRQEYERALAEARLATRPLGRDWLAAARVAVASPTAISPPYRETGFFDPARPGAVAFALDLRRGEEVVVQLATAPLDLPLFLELLRPGSEAGAEWEVLAAAADGRTLRYAPRADARLVLLLQPELLSGGRYTLDVTAAGTLAFPVEDPAAATLSPFGTPRDRGARLHEGVDIAAARGTPALAAADGSVLAARESPLGGRVVWLRTDSGLTLYYAHLDRFRVREGDRVARGEAVGEVGDTGNARGTRPHLHFEVHAGGERLDPEPWIRPPREPEPVAAELDLLGTWCRATRDGARLRGGPATSYPIVAELGRDQAARVAAAARDWYRVELPDGRRGYTAALLLAPADAPLRRLPLHAPLELRAGPAPRSAPVARLEAGARIAVLALAGETVLVEGPGGKRGWMELP
jgi:murein DD-endopeptidase MepM/ murein hydrolase activator NlpD